MKKSTIIILWGVITGVANSIFYHVLNMTGNMEGSLRYISWIIIFGGLLVGSLQYRKANGGYASFGEAYKAGILMTVIIAVLGTIWFGIYLNMHPDFPQQIMDQQRTAMVNRGMSADQIDRGMSMSKNFMTPTALLVFSLIGSVLSGAIMSLLSSAIATKKRPPFQEDDTIVQ